MILFKASMGFLGISLVLVMGLAYILSITSFGVPFMSPVAPHYPSSNDNYLRAPTFKQWLRPANISQLNPIRKKSKRK